MNATITLATTLQIVQTLLVVTRAIASVGLKERTAKLVRGKNIQSMIFIYSTWSLRLHDIYSCEAICISKWKVNFITQTTFCKQSLSLPTKLMCPKFVKNSSTCIDFSKRIISTFEKQEVIILANDLERPLHTSRFFARG